jgi:Tat protein secretion system quality control protein TatD with DNase activity
MGLPTDISLRGETLVDFHCHLDLYPDHAGVVAACERARVRTLAVTTTPRAWPRNRELANATRYVRAALGLHPQLVGERAAELTLWEQYLPQARYVGEVGLDAGPRYFRTLDLQKTVFTRILQACARVGDRVLSVHNALPVERLLTETDGPFTAVGDRPATPADVGATVLRLAEVRGMDPAALRAAIRENLRRLLLESDAASAI